MFPQCHVEQSYHTPFLPVTLDAHPLMPLPEHQPIHVVATPVIINHNPPVLGKKGIKIYIEECVGEGCETSEICNPHVKPWNNPV